MSLPREDPSLHSSTVLHEITGEMPCSRIPIEFNSQGKKRRLKKGVAK